MPPVWIFGRLHDSAKGLPGNAFKIGKPGGSDLDSPAFVRGQGSIWKLMLPLDVKRALPEFVLALQLDPDLLLHNLAP